MRRREEGNISNPSFVRTRFKSMRAKVTRLGCSKSQALPGSGIQEDDIMPGVSVPSAELQEVRTCTKDLPIPCALFRSPTAAAVGRSPELSAPQSRAGPRGARALPELKMMELLPLRLCVGPGPDHSVLSSIVCLSLCVTCPVRINI